MVGVVVAATLVPAIAAGGIAILSEDPVRAQGGFVLLGVNVVLIVLAAIATLLVLESPLDNPDP